MDSQTFGEMIRKKRIGLGKSIREVAETIGISRSVLSKIERNQSTAPSNSIQILANILEIEYSFLQKKYWSERIYYELKGEDFAIESVALAMKRLEKEREGTTQELKRQDLINKIREYAQKQPIYRVWMFGSFARDEVSLDSDIDLLVKFDEESKIDLFDYIGIQQDLEDITGRKIDLVEEGQQLPHIKSVIEKEKQLIYERQAI